MGKIPPGKVANTTDELSKINSLISKLAGRMMPPGSLGGSGSSHGALERSVAGPAVFPLYFQRAALAEVPAAGRRRRSLLRPTGPALKPRQELDQNEPNSEEIASSWPIARKHLLPDPLFFRCIFSGRRLRRCPPQVVASHGPSYRAHPQLYLRCRAGAWRMSGLLRVQPLGEVN